MTFKILKKNPGSGATRYPGSHAKLKTGICVVCKILNVWLNNLRMYGLLGHQTMKNLRYLQSELRYPNHMSPDSKTRLGASDCCIMLGVCVCVACRVHAGDHQHQRGQCDGGTEGAGRGAGRGQGSLLCGGLWQEHSGKSQTIDYLSVWLVPW